MTPVDPTHQDRFFLRQRFRPMVNQYEVSTLGPDEKSAGEEICFVEQKRMKLKEDLRALHGRFEDRRGVSDQGEPGLGPPRDLRGHRPDGQPGRKARESLRQVLLRSTWRIYDTAGNELALGQERSLSVALFRRLIGLVPFIGELLELLPIPYHFDYYAGEERIGGLQRILGLRDRYRLDVSGDAGRKIDRRVVLALAVGMDALQAR